MTVKQIAPWILYAIAAYAAIWLFNHINPWLGVIAGGVTAFL